MAGTQQEQVQQAPASAPQAAAAGTDVKEPAAAAAQTQPPATTAAAPAAVAAGSTEPQVEAQQPAAAQTQAAGDGSAPAGDAAAVPPTTSGQEASGAAAAPKLATFGASSSMFSGGGFGAIGALRHCKSVGGNRLLPGSCTSCYWGPVPVAAQGGRGGKGALLPTTAFMSCLGVLPCTDTDSNCSDLPGKAADLAATWGACTTIASAAEAAPAACRSVRHNLRVCLWRGHKGQCQVR